MSVSSFTLVKGFHIFILNTFSLIEMLHILSEMYHRKNYVFFLVFVLQSDILYLLISQSFTQYIPLSIYDLQQWMGTPSIYVYDCSCAGIIVDSFKQFALQREQEMEVCIIGSNYISIYLYKQYDRLSWMSITI